MVIEDCEDPALLDFETLSYSGSGQGCVMCGSVVSRDSGISTITHAPAPRAPAYFYRAAEPANQVANSL